MTAPATEAGPPEKRLKTFRVLWAAGVILLVALSVFSTAAPPYRVLLYPITLDNALHFTAFALLA